MQARNRLPTLCALAMIALLFVACSPGADEATPTPAPPDATAEPVAGIATVDGIEIVMLESMPVQVHVVARGHLPDGCTRIDKITQGFDEAEDRLWVEITTLRQPDAVCTEALVPFEETIPLNVYGLPAGTYTVDVNGVTGMFVFTVDNVPPAEETPAQVSTVNLRISESFPVQVAAVARGSLPDGCTKINEITQGFDEGEDRLWVEITTLRQPGEACTEALVPFEETVPLEVYGLPAGEYTVEVNGVAATLTLEQDNALEDDDAEDDADLGDGEEDGDADDADDGGSVDDGGSDADSGSDDGGTEGSDDGTGDDDAGDGGEMEGEVIGPARLASMDIRVTPASPVKAEVIARGSYPDDCTELKVEQRRDLDANTLWMELILVRTGTDCTAGAVPFEETFDLDLSGLPAGEYKVDVNGIAGGIVLGAANP